MTSECLRTVPVSLSADVVVCGGGPAGLCAAVAAAQEGADTLLIERYGFLGGMATAGLVNPFMPHYTGGEQIIAGLFQEIIDRLDAAGGWSHRQDNWARDAFDPETMKLVAQELARESGARLRLHTLVVDAMAEAGEVGQVLLASKSGLEAVEGKVFVDATGDADVAARAGAAYEQGRPEDGLCQPMTLNFNMAGVDESRLPPREEINALYEQAKAAGEIDNPRENVLWFYSTRPGEIHFNTTRVIKRDGTNAADLTEAELEGRRQMKQTVRFLVTKVPGFEDAYLATTGPQIGVRETRRIVGEYVLTAEDVLGARKFADGIARGCYDIDIHNPAGTGTVIRSLPEGESYDIPYRCLCPRGFGNLLVAGRPISTTHEAHSSVRVMAIAAAVGEAAGVAAAQAARLGQAAAHVDVAALRARLRARGASLSAG